MPKISVLPAATAAPTDLDNNLYPVSRMTGAGSPITEKLSQRQLIQGISGDAFIVVGTNTSAVQNGTDLVNAYSAAKTKTPHGIALADTNRYTIFLLPGQYTLTAAALVLDTNFIDLIGLSNTAKNVRLTSTGATLSQTTATNALIVNMTIHSSVAAPATNADPTAYFPNTALGLTARCFNVIFDGTNDGGAMRQGVNYSGTFINCICKAGFGFGTTIGATAGASSGYFEKCYVVAATAANAKGFGTASASAAGSASGTFIDCQTQSAFAGGAGGGACTIGAAAVFRRCYSNVTITIDGQNFALAAGSGAFGGNGVGTAASIPSSAEFTDCNAVGSDYSFGGSSIANTAITCTATFNRCTASSNGFGTGLTFDGTVINCSATASAFGTNGIFSGVARYCTATTNSFGSNGTMSGRMEDCTFSDCTANITGTMIRCRSTSATDNNIGNAATNTGTLDACSFLGKLNGAWSGTIQNMTVKAIGVNTEAIRVVSTCKLYNLTAIGTGTAQSINATVAANVIMSHCRTNLGINANVTNLVTTPFNVDNTNIA